MPPANVRTIEALKDVRHALIVFSERLHAALASAESDVSRTGQWLTHDRPQYWKRELRKREEAVVAAKAEIARKQFVAAPGPASVVLEKRLLAKAEERVLRARQREAATRKWAGVWEREVLMARGPLFALGEFVSDDIARAIARIERMIENIEEYIALAAPSSELPEAPTDASNAGAAGGMSRPTPIGAGTLAPDPAVLRAIASAAMVRARPPHEPLDHSVWAAGQPSGEEAAILSRLSFADAPPAPEEPVVLSARAMTDLSVWLCRLPDTPQTRGGWYVGPLQGPDISGACWKVTAGEFADAHPGLAGILALRAPTVVVLVAGGVQAVFDEEGRNLWVPGV